MYKVALPAMIQELAPIYKEKGIYIGTVHVTGVIGSNEHFSAKSIADEFWKLYSKVKHKEI